MAGQTPNHPRLRVLIALAVLTTAALFGVATFSGATGGQATEDRTGWYGTVRESVEILVGGCVGKGELSRPRGVAGKPPAKHR